MFYQINRDISNPLVKNKVDTLFGTTDWANEEFVNLRGYEREKAILNYYVKRTGAKYFVPFTIKFGRDEGPSSQQTKYYLIHATNHILGLQKMVDTMWKWSENEGSLEVGAQSEQMLLFPVRSTNQLKEDLQKWGLGKRRATFDEIRKQTWHWYYREKHYRAALKELKKEGVVETIAVSSKTASGLRGKDIVQFRL